MNYYDDITNRIANRYIWKSGAVSENLNSDIASIANFLGGDPISSTEVYGVAQVGNIFNPILDVFVSPTSIMRQLEVQFRDYSKHCKLRYFKTTPFTTQVNIGDRIANSRLARSYGTLGGFAIDTLRGYYLAVSNNHVLANTNNCLIGDNIVSRHTGNIFGQLHNYQTLVRPPFRNLIDAAVSTIDTNHFPYPYSTVRRRPALAIIGSRVSKFGARTGRRWGRIISINAQIIVNYGGTGNLNFMQTIVIRGENGPFSLPGDSGSFVINEHGHVVGLLFSGNGTDLSFANHISHVQTHLGIDF